MLRKRISHEYYQHGPGIILKTYYVQMGSCADTGYVMKAPALPAKSLEYFILIIHMQDINICALFCAS